MKGSTVKGMEWVAARGPKGCCKELLSIASSAPCEVH